jgi:hypothetical protein
MTNTATTDQAVAGEDIVARGGTYYRYTRYAFSALILGFGLWFAYDGFHRYPMHNEMHRLHVLDPVKYPDDFPTHSQSDINLQRILAVVLPPLAIGMLGWTLYNSRGAYRLSGDTLRVPGHPPVPLNSITQIDLSKWDRKGIAYLDYELPTGKGRLKLDDFVYDRPPTDRILDRIKEALGVESAAAQTPPADSPTES